MWFFRVTGAPPSNESSTVCGEPRPQRDQPASESGKRGGSEGSSCSRASPGTGSLRGRQLRDAGDQCPGGRATRPPPGGNPQPQAAPHVLPERAGAAGQPANEDGLGRHRVVWHDGRGRVFANPPG